MSYIFNKCTSLKELNLSYCNIKYNTNMAGMFSGCMKELKKETRKKIKK